MFNIHEFFLGFWTSLSIILAAFYIIICCHDDIVKLFNKTADEINNYIDDNYFATAQKLPNDEHFIVHV